MSSAAQWERRIIGQRTRYALAVKKAQGATLGRPKTLADDIVCRIIHENQSGAGWSTIARHLNETGVPTAHGGQKWHASTVRAVVIGSTS